MWFVSVSLLMESENHRLIVVCQEQGTRKAVHKAKFYYRSLNSHFSDANSNLFTMIGFPSLQIQSVYVVTHIYYRLIDMAYICTQVLFRRVLKLQD